MSSSQTQLDDIAHEQTIIWRQLFAGHVVGIRLIKKEEKEFVCLTSILKFLLLKGR